MKNLLHSAALFVICVLTAIPVLAECPEGKSEVILMTPKGVTKTICVSDNAIPGIENAAEHSGSLIIAAECPCLDVWDGAPYPDSTQIDGTGILPVLPPSVPPDTQCTALVSSGGMRTYATWDDPTDGIPYLFSARFGYYENPSQQDDSCSAHRNVSNNPDKPEYSTVSTYSLDGQIFTDAAISPAGIYTSSMMDACKAVLAARGCVFD
jgi:hypothetical protein